MNMTENGELIVELPEFLNDAQADELRKLGMDTKHAIRAADDAELTAINGIGLATATKLREWSAIDVPEGCAISKRYLILTRPGKKKIDDDGKLAVAPGDIIPAEFEPEQYVKKGQAVWQHQPVT